MIRALLVVAIVLVPLVTRAQAPTRVVEVLAAGSAPVTQAMASRVRSLEARLGISVRWDDRDRIDARDVIAEREPSPDVLARVWLDLSDSDRAVLFIANAASDRFLVRVVPIGDGYGELSRESLVTIVESVVDALLAGGQIGVDRESAAQQIEAEVGTPVLAPPEPPAALPPVVSTPPPPPPTPATDRLRSAIDLRYRIDAVAGDVVLRHGPELAFSWTGFVRPELDLLIAFSARYDPPYALGDAARGVMLHGGGLRAAIGATGRIGDVFVWQAAVGGGADLAYVEPHFAPETGLVTAAPFTLAIPIATAYLSAAIRPAPWIELAIGLGLDLDLAGHHFDVQSGPSRMVLVDPWPAHPFGFFGVGIPLEV